MVVMGQERMWLRCGLKQEILKRVCRCVLGEAGRLSPRTGHRQLFGKLSRQSPRARNQESSLSLILPLMAV